MTVVYTNIRRPDRSVIDGLAASGVAGAGGWLVGLDWAEITCLAVVAAVVAAMLVLAARRHRRKADGPYCDVEK